jgi:hypothetical protein
MDRRPNSFSYQGGAWITTKSAVDAPEGAELEKALEDAGYKRLFTYGGAPEMEAVDVWRLEKDNAKLPLYLVYLAEDEFGFVEVSINSLPDLTRFCQDVRGFVLGLTEYINRESDHG